MDTKEVLLLLGLIIEILRDLVTWIQGQFSDPGIPGVGEGVAAIASWFVSL
jgi:hypothetical protein